MKFFIGTTNPNKVAEIADILNATGCRLEVTDPLDPPETETDFIGNALLKARVYAAHAGGLTISEDSGIVVPAIGGLPGPWSARFSECEIDKTNWSVVSHKPSGLNREQIDHQNNLLLLSSMEGVEQPYRAAQFVVVLIVAAPDGQILFQGLGQSYGWIAENLRGSNGFGYDPVFVGQDTFGKTYAELDPMRKNLRSHRRKVLRDFTAWLGQFLRENPE